MNNQRNNRERRALDSRTPAFDPSIEYQGSSSKRSRSGQLSMQRAQAQTNTEQTPRVRHLQSSNAAQSRSQSKQNHVRPHKPRNPKAAQGKMRRDESVGRTQDRSQNALRGSKSGHKRRASQAGYEQSRQRRRPQGAPRQQARVAHGTRSLAPRIVLILILILAVLCVIDGVRNCGVVHSGVRIGSADVGLLSTEDAETRIKEELSMVANSAPVALYASEDAEARGVTSETLDLGHGGQAHSSAEDDVKRDSWSVTLATFDTQIDEAQLAEEAYSVGRGLDFIPGRLGANLFGITIEPKIEFSPQRLESVQEAICESMGSAMQNASVSFNGTKFKVQDGHDGYAVDEAKFVPLLQEAFLSEERTLIVPLVESKMQVGLEEAQKTAESLQSAIQKPLTVKYNGDSWTLDTTQLGALIVTEAEQVEGQWKLVPHVDIDVLKDTIYEVAGTIAPTVAPVDASFSEVNGELKIIPGQNGTGFDFKQLAGDIETLLFTEEGEDPDAGGESRTIEVFNGEFEPGFTVEDAEAMDFSTIISQYTIQYESIADGSKHNLQNAADILNSSIIAPQSEWSLISKIGVFTEETGFVLGQVIDGDSYQMGMGGGVCNIATTIFNTVYEAGYPITERVQHSLRGVRYPLGRDAAIAYPYSDLKFVNDTDNYLLLTLSYDGKKVTGTLWGVPPGYTVESIEGEFYEIGDYRTEEVYDETLAPGERVVVQEGLKASEIEVTRIVYDAEGNLKDQQTYFSSYYATAEVVNVGPPAS